MVGFIHFRGFFLWENISYERRKRVIVDFLEDLIFPTTIEMENLLFSLTFCSKQADNTERIFFFSGKGIVDEFVMNLLQDEFY